MPTLDLQIAASGDDAFITEQIVASQVFNPTSGISRIGNTNATNYDHVILGRFLNVLIPFGANIDVCYATFTPWASRTGLSIDFKYQFEASGDALQIIDYADYASRVLTTANVIQNNVPAWTIDVKETSVDLSGPLQEVIDDVSWASGNAVALYVRPDFASVGAYRDIHSWDGDVLKALQLHVEYTETLILLDGQSDLIFGGFSDLEAIVQLDAQVDLVFGGLSDISVQKSSISINSDIIRTIDLDSKVI